MKDYCPNCGARRGDITSFVCYHDFHKTVPYKPELVFSFRLPGPQYSKTVSEAQLKETIADARRGPLYSMDQNLILALAAERMIELAKIKPPPMPTPVSALDPSRPIRPQLEDMLLYVGLEPDRFLTKRPDSPFNYGLKEPSSMCDPEKVSKPDAHRAASELATMLSSEIDVSVNPVILRLWLIERWEKVAKLAHKIHGSA